MKKRIICILSPIIIAIITVRCLNIFLNKNIKLLLETKDLTEINLEYGSMYKDRGVIFNENSTKNNDVVLQGSSELASPVPQLPSQFFPIEGLNTVVTNGRAYCQNLNHISILGSENETNNERKVAMVLSIQWFFNENGTEPNSFQANFSPAQFYGFLENEKISEKNKKEYATRIDSLLSGSSQFAPEKIYARIYTNNGIKYKVANVLFTPYFVARKNIVELKDKGLLYKKLRKLPQKSNTPIRKVDWKDEYRKAEEEGKEKVTNNDFMVYDTYYDLHLKDNIEAQKDSNKGVDLMKSKEFSDYELYLDTCVDLGIKPYIILMPTNGLWYDHTGMNKDVRAAFYDKVQKMAEKRGFEVLNLKDEEYTPYFMCDVMHFGWKGWLRVDEEIYKHFKN